MNGSSPASEPLWRVDLHMHTSHSPDCLSPPGAVVSRARAVGLDRIAITDHDEISGAFAAAELAPELVIVGEEVRTAEGLDLIGLFLEDYVVPGRSMEETAEAIRAQGGLTYLPHPFDSHRGADEAFFDERVSSVDLVEGFNARIHDPDRNARAVRWARRHDLPLGAGSDAHLLTEIGRGVLACRPFEGPRGLLDAARAGQLEGQTSGRWVHLGSTWAKIRGALPF